MFRTLSVRSSIFSAVAVATLQVACSNGEATVEVTDSNLDADDGSPARPEGCSNFADLQVSVALITFINGELGVQRDATGKALHSRTHAKWTCLSVGDKASLPLRQFGFYFPQGAPKAEPKDLGWLTFNTIQYTDASGAWVSFPRPLQILLENQVYGIAIGKCMPNAATVALEAELEAKLEKARASQQTQAEFQKTADALRETFRLHLIKAQFVTCRA